jgi:hypothetical protein
VNEYGRLTRICEDAISIETYEMKLTLDTVSVGLAQPIVLKKQYMPVVRYGEAPLLPRGSLTPSQTSYRWWLMTFAEAFAWVRRDPFRGGINRASAEDPRRGTIGFRPARDP